jgi:hypothetical protein
MDINNNQTVDGFDVGRGFGEGARPGRNVWDGEDGCPLFGAAN